MKVKIKIILLFLCLFSTVQADNFVAGKDYEEMSFVKAMPVGEKVSVVEFFSFGCPWCYRLESSLEHWLKSKQAKRVDFQRVPVVFAREWEIFAKAYYAAEALGVADKVVPALFHAVQDEGNMLQSEAEIEKVFVKQGVKAKAFQRAFNFTPEIVAKLNNGRTLMVKYRITRIPTLVVAGKYKFDTGMARGSNERMIQVLNYLIAKKH